MPIAPSTSNPTLSRRRSGFITRGRENRAHTPNNEAPRAVRRGHSPDIAPLEDTSTRNDPNTRKKRKPPTVPHVTTHHTRSSKSTRDSVASDEMGIDRPKKGKKPSSAPGNEVEVVVIQDTQTKQKSKRREQSRSRDTLHKTSTKVTDSDDESQDAKTYSGPIATAEYLRMQNELHSLKKHMYHAEKTIRKQGKELDKLRKDLSTAQQTSAEHSTQVEKLKKQARKSDEVISTIEGHMNCLICMDILCRPHGLSPCGHVLCQGCLQEWFRTAPAGDDDMFDDDMDDPVLYRKKICPVCRTVVRSRPIPLFVVKSIAGALQKHKPSPTRQASPPPEDDPWAGIFANSLDDIESEDEDSDDDEFDDDDDLDTWSSDVEGYGSDEDEEQYDGAYVHPRWQPPTVHISPEDYHFLDDLSREELSMLRRGVTLPMMNLFHMRYDHDTGLQAIVDGHNIVHLGWNIRLRQDDESGEDYMDWIVRDIQSRPERWERRDDLVDGSWEAWKLIPEDDDDEEFYLTDSDAWAADLAAVEADDGILSDLL
ncbi:hypothetical protein K474DRAFT_1661361 [Panus rudis PR-1116 ss-1]|nr:hypothetical protein K474DRAFT_1661361 [Panus rudis PR-1116 ss-1]